MSLAPHARSAGSPQRWPERWRPARAPHGCCPGPEPPRCYQASASFDPASVWIATMLHRLAHLSVRQRRHWTVRNEHGQATTLLDVPGRYGGLNDCLPSFDSDVDLLTGGQAELVTDRLGQHDASCLVDG